MLLGSFLTDIGNNLTYLIIAAVVVVFIICAVVVYFFVYHKKVKAKQRERQEIKAEKAAEREEIGKTASNIFSQRDARTAAAEEYEKQKHNQKSNAALAEKMSAELNKARAEDESTKLNNLKNLAESGYKVNANAEEQAKMRERDNELANKFTNGFGVNMNKTSATKMTEEEIALAKKEQRAQSKADTQKGKELNDILSLGVLSGSTRLAADKEAENKVTAESNKSNEDRAHEISGLGNFDIGKGQGEHVVNAETQEQDKERLAEVNNSFNYIGKDENNENEGGTE